MRVTIMRADMACSVRAGSDRRTHALASLARPQARDEVERAADTRSAELDRHRAAIQLRLAECVERESSEVAADRNESRERHAVDEDRRVSGRRTAHAD